MKVYLLFYIFLFIPYFVLSEINKYNNLNYSASSINENLSNITIMNNNTLKNVVYITKNDITITDSIIFKKGDTINYGLYSVNSAILVNGGGLTIIRGLIGTSVKGINAIVSTSNGTVRINGTNIILTGDSYSKGLQGTYGGKIIASNIVIKTIGISSTTLSSEYGIVICTDCELETWGLGSPLIHSVGTIKVTNTRGLANKAQAIVIEGNKSETVINSSYLKCNANPNKNKHDQCGILMHESISGNIDHGTSSFTCQNSTVEILSSSNYSSLAPMFLIINTNANINLNKCNFTYGSNIFLKIDKNNFGDSDSKGRTITLTLKNQNIVGDIIVAQNCSLKINLIKSTIIGTINKDKTASKLSIISDSDSSITLTGNSYYTSFKNYISNNSNINTGNHTWRNYEISASNTNNRKGHNKKINNFSSYSNSISSGKEEDEIYEDVQTLETVKSLINPSLLKNMLIFILFIDCVLLKIIIK